MNPSLSLLFWWIPHWLAKLALPCINNHFSCLLTDSLQAAADTLNDTLSRRQPPQGCTHSSSSILHQSCRSALALEQIQNSLGHSFMVVVVVWGLIKILIKIPFSPCLSPPFALRDTNGPQTQHEKARFSLPGLSPMKLARSFRFHCRNSSLSALCSLATGLFLPCFRWQCS